MSELSVNQASPAQLAETAVVAAAVLRVAEAITPRLAGDSTGLKPGPGGACAVPPRSSLLLLGSAWHWPWRKKTHASGCSCRSLADRAAWSHERGEPPAPGRGFRQSPEAAAIKPCVTYKRRASRGAVVIHLRAFVLPAPRAVPAAGRCSCGSVEATKQLPRPLRTLRRYWGSYLGELRMAAKDALPTTRQQSCCGHYTSANRRSTCEPPRVRSGRHGQEVARGRRATGGLLTCGISVGDRRSCQVARLRAHKIDDILELINGPRRQTTLALQRRIDAALAGTPATFLRLYRRGPQRSELSLHPRSRSARSSPGPRLDQRDDHPPPPWR